MSARQLQHDRTYYRENPTYVRTRYGLFSGTSHILCEVRNNRGVWYRLDNGAVLCADYAEIVEAPQSLTACKKLDLTARAPVCDAIPARLQLARTRWNAMLHQHSAKSRKALRTPLEPATASKNDDGYAGSENAQNPRETANSHEDESAVLKIKAADWAVQPTSIEAARQIIEQYHYAGGAGNTAVYVHGLFRRGSVELVGVAWWCAAVKGSVDKYNAGGESTTLVLQRLAISPDAPNNAASFLLGRSIRLIKQDARFDYLITYADTYRNHTGQIYRATNWEYRGESDPTPVWIDSSGRQWSRKNGNGGSYTHEQMKARGAALAGYYAKHVYTMALKLHRRPLPQQIPLIETESAVYDATAKRLGYEKVGAGSYRSASHLAQEALVDNGFEPVEAGSAIYRQSAQRGVEYSPAVDSVRETKFQLRQERKAAENG